MAACVFAQPAPAKLPVRTAEEIASKQTEMLSRELGLSEQQRDTIYQIHLKYARMREKSNTRQEAMERMNAMTSELLNVLTPKQREAFLNKQVDVEPRRVQGPPRFCRDSLQEKLN